MTRIVAGVDGSEASTKALRWAVEEARLRDAVVEVVVVWRMPIYTGPGFDVSWVDPAEMERGAEAAAVAAIDLVRPDAEGVELTPVLLRGHVGKHLVEQARGAALLVLGSRGLGGFTGALMGSVSTYCVHHSHETPVVVVPSEGHHDEHQG